MLKLSVGDLIFMTLGIAATAVMLLMGPGKETIHDPAAERRTKKIFLEQINRRRGPVMTIVIIIVFAAAAYVGLIVYGKTR